MRSSDSVARLPRRRNRLEWFSACGIIILEALAEPGGSAPELWGEIGAAIWRHLLLILDMTVAAIFSWRFVESLRDGSDTSSVIRTLTLLVGLLAGFWSTRVMAAIFLVHDGIGALRAAMLEGLSPILSRRLRQSPALMLALSFILMIACGAILLMFPGASTGPRVNVTDAWFTAVSASCVTGLITLDTAKVWSPFGLFVITFLIQIGGLGVMVFGAAAASWAGVRLSSSGEELARNVFETDDTRELRWILRTVILGTFLIELIGAIALYPTFSESLGHTLPAVGYAFFHSISAFCNAGFALYSSSLIHFQADLWFNSVLVILVTLGGLGFGVVVGLLRFCLRRHRFLSLHARVVLGMSFTLTLGGGLMFFLFEFDGILRGVGLADSLLISFFQSATTRTAGFNTVPIDELSRTTLMWMMVWMAIGASPGSTGGGVKTTTVFVLLAAMFTYSKQDESIIVSGRTLPTKVVFRALAVLGGATVIWLIGMLLIIGFEPDKDFLALAFEVTSALGTAGLSLGITSELSISGKWLVSALMFLGRIGPLTLAVATFGTRQSRHVKYPRGRILIG